MISTHTPSTQEIEAGRLLDSKSLRSVWANTERACFRKKIKRKEKEGRKERRKENILIVQISKLWELI